MHLVSRLRRIMAMTTVLLSLLAGLGVASAQADAPILTGGGGRQTPRVADETPGISSSNATSTPLPSPSPIQATTPLNPTASPDTPSSTTGTTGSTDSAPVKSAEKTDDKASHTVCFDPDDGSKTTQSTVKTGTLATPLQQNPQRQGFRFDGWTYDGQPFDFQMPILQDTTLKAHWSETTDWRLSPDHGPASGTVLTISPPDRQEPYYVNVQAGGDQIVSLTGDGRIYTSMQNGTPKQVPFPVQAPEGFHYLQTAAGSRWQAALGPDQQIYTWTSQQPAPSILDTGQNTKFTSISMNDDRLLAVDQQGRIHAFQASLTGSQKLNPKPPEQATIRLPGKTQAVTAVGSSNRTLVLDTDGQAWTWDTASTGKAKTTRISHDPDMHIIQVQALNQGFLLLEADGQAYYMDDGKAGIIAAGLPEGIKASSIASNKDQAMITDKDGCLWIWKLGDTPERADNKGQAYTQATAAGSRITAISRQGEVFTWSLDGQGQPGKPARLDTTTAPTLESASLDSQALKLSKNNGSWQADMPARKPGPAAITITGRQDGQPFTRSLTYTVDQPLTRAAEPRSTLTVHFDTGGGEPEPADQSFTTPNSRVKRPSPDPSRQGFLFDGWFINQVAYDFSRPVTKDLTLTAHWSPASRNTKWSISPDKGSQLGREPTTITPPDNASRGIRFNQISASTNGDSSLAVGSDGNAYAWGSNGNGQLGDGTQTMRTTPVMVGKPAGAPADFTYVQVSAGTDHSLALGSDGNAYSWGSNSSGQLGNNQSYATSLTPAMVKKPADAPADFTYVQVSAGDSYSLAVGSDGYAYAWGYNGYGQLGNNSISESLVPVRVRDPANPTDTNKGLQAVQVSAGDSYSLAVGSDGNTYAWGKNADGQLGDGTSFSRNTPAMVKKPEGKPADFTYVQVSAGYAHSLAVGSDGYAYAWGYNGYGQLGNNSISESLVPVRVRDPANPTDTNKGLQAVQVSAGYFHSLAVGSNGYIYTWGYNSNGQLGNKTADPSVPVLTRDPANPTDTNKGLQAVQVSGGQFHSLAIGTDGSAEAWGSNEFGQLGNDSIPTGNYTSRVLTPVPVVFNLAPVITGVKFDSNTATGLTRGDGGSVTVLTPAHLPGMVTVSVDYTLGGAPQAPDTSLRYTYLPAGVLPQAGGEGILLALATGMTGMGGVLASRRHRREQHRLSHASHE